MLIFTLNVTKIISVILLNKIVKNIQLAHYIFSSQIYLLQRNMPAGDLIVYVLVSHLQELSYMKNKVSDNSIFISQLTKQFTKAQTSTIPEEIGYI